MRKPIDPAFKKALLEGPEKVAAPLQEPAFASDLSIDSMLQRGLSAIDRLMRVITMDISSGHPSRETVMNLRDAMSMLESLKKREQELLEGMSDDDLKKAAEQ